MNLSILENNSPQIILFRDRIEYYKKRKLHNINGPAIKPINDSSSLMYVHPQYYIWGEQLNYDDWVVKSEQIKRKKKIQKIKRNNGRL